MTVDQSGLQASSHNEQPGRTLLEARQIEVVYNHVQMAVQGLSIEVPEKGIVTVLGPNGAGKTTLLRAITGFLPSENAEITDGDVIFDGKRITGLPPYEVARLGISLVPEEESIFRTLSVEDNLRIVPHPRGEKARVEAVERMYDLFPVLAKRRSQVAGYMSGGERQMLAVARAMLLEPRVLLVDELSFGLAPVVVRRLMQVLVEINRVHGTSIVLVEQNASAALSVAHYAYIVETGRIVFDGTPAKLRANEDVQEFYLGLSERSGLKSYADVKQYRRKRRWWG